MVSRHPTFPLSIFLLAVCSSFSQLPAAAPGELARQLNDAYVGVFESASPSVVVIESEMARKTRPPIDMFGNQPIPDPDGNQPPQSPELSEGSGIICRADGYIYTNNHVVDPDAKMTVKLKDGRTFPAKVVGSDPMSEVAVIKIEAKDLPVATFADSSEVRVGQLACVIGSPYNFTYSFTVGVISGKGRNQNLLESRWSGIFEDFLQTDAAINPGNSGGPLLDIDGRVVGMNTLIQGIGKGLGFAISSNMLRKIGDELIEHGKIIRPWLGLGIQSVKEAAKSSKRFSALQDGVIVQSLSDDGPALASELRPLDVILKVDGVPVPDTIDLQREVQKKKVGVPVQLVVWREGREITIPVRTAEMPGNLDRHSRNDDAVPPNDPGLEEDKPDAGNPEEEEPSEEIGPEKKPSLGMEVQVLTPELAMARRLKTKTGLIVTDVVPGSEAAAAGVEVGDAITEVNSQPVSDEKSFSEALAKGDKAKGTLLFVERDKGSAFLVLKSDDVK